MNNQILKNDKSRFPNWPRYAVKTEYCAIIQNIQKYVTIFMYKIGY